MSDKITSFPPAPDLFRRHVMRRPYRGLGYGQPVVFRALGLLTH